MACPPDIVSEAIARIATYHNTENGEGVAARASVPTESEQWLSFFCFDAFS
jgi:hypothetical protein